MLLAGDRVADLSLNELARQVGLAKSNVLRYFETREAVLLELLNVEYDAWLDDVEARLSSTPDTDDVERLADAISRAAEERPVLSELLANAAMVLEHNLSIEAAANYKRAAIRQGQRLATIIDAQIGPLPETVVAACAGTINLVIGGAWSMTCPYPVVAAVYDRYPDLVQLQLDFRVLVRELTATSLVGLTTRGVSLDP